MSGLKLLFIIKKDKLNENRFYLLTKLEITNSQEISWGQFSGRQFSWGAIFSGEFFLDPRIII